MGEEEPSSCHPAMKAALKVKLLEQQAELRQQLLQLECQQELVDRHASHYTESHAPGLMAAPSAPQRPEMSLEEVVFVALLKAQNKEPQNPQMSTNPQMTCGGPTPEADVISVANVMQLEDLQRKVLEMQAVHNDNMDDWQKKSMKIQEHLEAFSMNQRHGLETPQTRSDLPSVDWVHAVKSVVPQLTGKGLKLGLSIVDAAINNSQKMKAIREQREPLMNQLGNQLTGMALQASIQAELALHSQQQALQQQLLGLPGLIKLMNDCDHYNSVKSSQASSSRDVMSSMHPRLPGS